MRAVILKGKKGHEFVRPLPLKKIKKKIIPTRDFRVRMTARRLKYGLLSYYYYFFFCRVHFVFRYVRCPELELKYKCQCAGTYKMSSREIYARKEKESAMSTPFKYMAYLFGIFSS